MSGHVLAFPSKLEICFSKIKGLNPLSLGPLSCEAQLCLLLVKLMIKVITWNSHGLLYHRNLGVIIVNGRSISNLKKFGSCISKPCIQDTLSSRARLAFRPSASREQKYRAYNSKPRVPNLLLFKKFAPEKFYLKQ